MAYLLGNRANDRRAITVARQRGYRQLISSMFDISPPTDHLATAVALRPVAAVVNRLVGVGLKGDPDIFVNVHVDIFAQLNFSASNREGHISCNR